MQAVRLPGEALTLSLAAALLCSGCTPLPPGDQSASASQVSTVSTSLSQVSSLRGRWTAWNRRRTVWSWPPAENITGSSATAWTSPG